MSVFSLSSNVSPPNASSNEKTFLCLLRWLDESTNLRLLFKSVFFIQFSIFIWKGLKGGICRKGSDT
jgi:hypothetical protein